MNALAAQLGGLDLVWPLAVALVFSLVSAAGLRRYPSWTCVLAIAGAAAYYRESAPGFAIACTGAYAFGRWLGARPTPAARWRWSTVALPVFFIVFLVGRRHAWAVTPSGLVLFSLDMWLVLRLVTLVWEIGSGAILVPPPRQFVTWVCLPLTLAGPLVRYSEFSRAASEHAWWRSGRWWVDLANATAKLLCGVLLGTVQQLLARQRPGDLLGGLAMVLVTGPLGFYLTYAGFFHLMQVFAVPAGFSLPDSFRWPIGRQNISEFWANWNMTATRVFRDYLFYNRWGRARHNVYLNLMVLFALVGLWHATNAYWLLWGILHGGLFCAFLVWRRYNTRLGSIPLRGTRIAKIAAAVLTYVCVCACWYLPSKILQRIGM